MRSFQSFFRLALCTTILLGSLTACDEDIACTMLAVDGIHVDVFDAQTGAGIADGAIGKIQDGTFTDSLTGRAMLRPEGPLRGATERPGRYTVTVDKPGYRQWKQENVRVVKTKDRCHVITVKLTAKMQTATAATTLVN